MANELLKDEIERLGPHVQGKSCWICDPNGTNCDVLFFARRLIKARKSQQRAMAVKDMMQRGVAASLRARLATRLNVPEELLGQEQESNYATNKRHLDLQLAAINAEHTSSGLPPLKSLRISSNPYRSKQEPPIEPIFEQIRTLSARLNQLQVEHDRLRAKFDRHRLR